MTDLTDKQKAAFEIMPKECWYFFWDVLQKVSVAGPAIDVAYQARSILREIVPPEPQK